MAKKLVLLSNDDGVHAEGLQVLYRSLLPDYEVVIVAPEEEMSASSHAVSLKKPLRIKEYSRNVYSVSGTPADSVIIALFHILKKLPDFMISGINLGPNMGEDVFYSGTVAAAREAALYNIPALAVSLNATKETQIKHFQAAALITRKVIPFLKNGMLLNLNVPNIPLEKIKGLYITKLSTRRYIDVVNENEDKTVSIGGVPIWQREKGSDIWAVENGYASLTPLLKDLTDYEGLKRLEVLFREVDL